MTVTSDVMNFIVDNRVPGLQPKVLADLFDRLTWILADNGEAVSTVQSEWLDGNDAVRVEIGLLMEEQFPAQSRVETEAKFARIAGAWPHLQSLCRRVLDRWDAQSDSANH